MVIIGLVIVFATIIIWEVPTLVKKKMWGELIVFSALLLVGVVYSFGMALNIPLPNPTSGIGKIFRVNL